MIQSEFEYNNILLRWASTPQVLRVFEDKLTHLGYTTEEVRRFVAPTRAFIAHLNAELAAYEETHGIKSRDIQ